VKIDSTESVRLPAVATRARRTTAFLQSRRAVASRRPERVDQLAALLGSVELLPGGSAIAELLDLG
jgi:hypothetical protein